ncbi:MAG: hypothetical protein M3R06_05730 [Chloroflexota bacterium]|nr:hypothetical protein [Chloroflexota bacterium]
MVALPLIAALLSLACAGLLVIDAVKRPRSDRIAWAIAFGLFALAASAEVFGSTLGWSPILARLYYLSGAVLVVGYLALGQLYLLVGRRIDRIAPGLTLLVTAFAVSLVWAAPIDDNRLTADGWQALERGPGLIALAAGINGIGTLVIVGGLLFSAWRFWRRGVHRSRMIGCLLIALGTLIVALGGTLTRFGAREFLYLAMAPGVALIFTGYLATRRPEGHSGINAAVGAPRARIVALASRRGPTLTNDPEIAYLEAAFLALPDAELDASCRAWSVPRRPGETLSREEARAVWALRLSLSPSGQIAFDAHTYAAKRQLSELYHEVFWRDEVGSG